VNSRTITRGIVVALSAAAVLAAGCGGDDEGGATTAATLSAAPQPATQTTPIRPDGGSAGDKGGQSGKDKAGSGGSGRNGGSSAGGGAPQPTAEDRAWVRRLCTSMAADAKALQPPVTDTSDPATVQRSLVRFLQQTNSQLSAQVENFRSVGDPPTERARPGYRRVLERLEEIESRMKQLQSEVEKAKPKNERDLVTSFQRIGRTMQEFANYGGPIADLAGRSGTLAKAINAERTCARLR